MGRSQSPTLLWCPPPAAFSHGGAHMALSHLLPPSVTQTPQTLHFPASSTPRSYTAPRIHNILQVMLGSACWPHMLQFLWGNPNFNESLLPASLTFPWTSLSSAGNGPALAFQLLLGVFASRAAQLLGSKEEHGKAAVVVFYTGIFIYSWVPKLAQRTLSNLSWIWGALKFGSSR